MLSDSEVEMCICIIFIYMIICVYFLLVDVISLRKCYLFASCCLCEEERFPLRERHTNTEAAVLLGANKRRGEEQREEQKRRAEKKRHSTY